jgi:hypothetical protein
MQMRVGFNMVYQCPQDTPMILALNIHYSRASDLLHPDHLVTQPAVPATAYRLHQRIQFGYHHARRTRTALEACNEGVGVCRDYAPPRPSRCAAA